MGNSISNIINKKNYALLSAINKFEIIEGKKALQKILYFTNLKSNVFPYQWNKYGPYSEEIKYLLDDAVMDGIVSIKQVPLQSRNATQYNMVLDKKAGQSLKSLGSDVKIDKGIDFAYNLLRGKTPREMELLASVHYIASYNKGRHSDRVYEIITELKPEANFSKDDVDSAITELKKLKILH